MAHSRALLGRGSLSSACSLPRAVSEPVNGVLLQGIQRHQLREVHGCSRRSRPLVVAQAAEVRWPLGLLFTFTVPASEHAAGTPYALILAIQLTD